MEASSPALRAKLPELLLPAGSFESALAAIEGGADALYFGFAAFSARKQAKNFGELEYRRLLKFARGRGIKLYAALNTVVLQGELEEAARLLAFLGRFPPDAVIVQDWGLARMIADRHPGIAIHASTQAAVQGPEAARIARELGASRIVLPRETSLEQMAAISSQVPELEYETFVHGALCYSFSGLCLASGLVLGRSGNRGDCAQLCRSYYREEGSGREGFWFSCRDLDLGGMVAELAAAGISSLKVEGRMKSPEYCRAVASLYRGYLDGLAGKGPSAQEMEARRESAALAFSRSPTEAWIAQRGGEELIDSAYPGHRGVAAGRIASSGEGKILLELSGPLGLRDGLLGFENGDPFRPIRFSVLELRDAVTGRELIRARAGTRVEIQARLEGKPVQGLRAGDELRRISSRDMDMRAPSPEEYEAAREELPLRLSMGSTGLGGDLGLPMPGGEERKWARIEAEGPIPMDIAKAKGGFDRALSLFAESGEADFVLLPSFDPESRVSLPPGPDGAGRSCAASELFIPPSALKREKNRIYARASVLVSEHQAEYARNSHRGMAGEGSVPNLGLATPAAPPRAALVFPREGLATGMPFAGVSDLAPGSELPSWGGRLWLPLAPLVIDWDSYSRLAMDKAASVLEAGSSLVLGLGALHHIAFARSLRERFPDAGPALAFFLDVNLYVANALARSSLSSLVPGIEFAYAYLELAGAEGIGLAEVGPGFEPPLFQSLGCYLKHHVAGGRCPKGCLRSLSVALSDRERRYRVLVEDCVTTMFRIGPEGRLDS